MQTTSGEYVLDSQQQHYSTAITTTTSYDTQPYNSWCCHTILWFETGFSNNSNYIYNCARIIISNISLQNLHVMVMCYHNQHFNDIIILRSSKNFHLLFQSKNDIFIIYHQLPREGGSRTKIYTHYRVPRRCNWSAPAARKLVFPCVMKPFHS